MPLFVESAIVCEFRVSSENSEHLPTTGMITQWEQADMRNRSRLRFQFQFQFQFHGGRMIKNEIRGNPVSICIVWKFWLFHAFPGEYTHIWVSWHSAVEDPFHFCKRSGGWERKWCDVGLVREYWICQKHWPSMAYYEGHWHTVVIEPRNWVFVFEVAFEVAVKMFLKT
jgi:hypothetical protein